VAVDGLGSGLGDDHPVLLFDGHCGLCNASVDFAMGRERDGVAPCTLTSL